MIGACLTALVSHWRRNPIQLFAYLAGWGPIAIPGPRGLGVLTVYILSPIAGAILGVGLYRLVIGPAMAATDEGG